MAKKSRHSTATRFQNTTAHAMTHADMVSVLKWQAQKRRVDPISFPVETQDHPWLIQNRQRSTLTWIGHATFLIQHNGLNIITDPHFSKRASPVQFAGPKRTTPPAMDIASLPTIDVVVISHDHYDHLDEQSVLAIVEKQKEHEPLFMVPLALGAWLTKRGIYNWVELDWWQSYEFLGWRFTAVPVQHFSGRGLQQNKTLWAGWVLESAIEFPETSKRFFFAGDTGYSNDFRDIRERMGAMDVSLIPIGAYEPRWFMKCMHVNPEEAVKIHLDVKSRFSVGMHWGSFVLTDEPMDEPPKALENAKLKYGLSANEFTVLTHGQVFDLESVLQRNQTKEAHDETIAY